MKYRVLRSTLLSKMASRRSTWHSRRGELLVSITDAVEMVQTEGSDIEEKGGGDIYSEFEPSEEEWRAESASEVVMRVKPKVV